jgi:hypothetical protein
VPITTHHDKFRHKTQWGVNTFYQSPKPRDKMFGVEFSNAQVEPVPNRQIKPDHPRNNRMETQQPTLTFGEASSQYLSMHS